MEREEEGDAERSVAFGKASEEHYHDQNQPDMICLPNRTHRPHNRQSLLSLPRPEREQVPDATAKVGSAEKGVGNGSAEGRESRQVDPEVRPPRHANTSFLGFNGFSRGDAKEQHNDRHRKQKVENREADEQPE